MGRRYEGTINQFRADKGFGFIRCEELRQGAFPEKDVFLHRLQILNFKEGDQVSFTLILNKDGKPQATQLGLPGQGPAAVTAQPQVQFVPQAAFVAPVVAARPAVLPPPPAPAFAAVPPVPAPAAVEAWDKHEVEVPVDIVPKLLGPVFLDVKQRAGNDISITLVDSAGEGPMRRVVVQGPPMSASIGACLLLQQIAELV